MLVNFKVSGSSTFDAIFVIWGSVREVLGAGRKWKGAQGFVGSKMADSMDVEDAERITDSLPGIGELKAFTQVLRLSF